MLTSENEQTGLAFGGQRHAYWQDQREMHTTPNTEGSLAGRCYHAPLSAKASSLLVQLFHCCQCWAPSFTIGHIPRPIPVDGRSTTTGDMGWPTLILQITIRNKVLVNSGRLNRRFARLVAASFGDFSWEMWDAKRKKTNKLLSYVLENMSYRMWKPIYSVMYLSVYVTVLSISFSVCLEIMDPLFSIHVIF